MEGGGEGGPAALIDGGGERRGSRSGVEKTEQGRRFDSSTRLREEKKGKKKKIQGRPLYSVSSSSRSKSEQWR